MENNTTSGIPPDVNPYPYYIERLHRVFYKNPSPGFSGRLWGLFALICVNLGLVAFRYGLQFVDHKRRKTRPWMYRWVSTPNGTFFLLSADTWTQLTMVIVDPIYLAYLLMERKWLVEQGDLRSLAIWRSIILLPLIFQTWFISWVNLFNGVIIAQSKGRMWPDWVPSVAIGIFVGGLICFAVPLIAFSILSSQLWYKVWDLYLNLQALNAAALPHWTSGPPSVDNRAEFLRLTVLASKQNLWVKGTQVTEMAALALTVLVASSGFPIYRLVRKQVTYSEVILKTRRASLQQATLAARYCAFGEPDEAEGLAPVIVQPFGRRKSAVSMDYALNQERRLADLRRASVKIMTHTLSMTVGCTAIFAALCWTVTIPFTEFFARPQPWYKIEIALFLPLWILNVGHILAMLSHTRHTIAHIPKRRHEHGDDPLELADPFEALYRNQNDSHGTVAAAHRSGRAARLQDHGLLKELEGIKVERTESVCQFDVL